MNGWDLLLAYISVGFAAYRPLRHAWYEIEREDHPEKFDDLSYATRDAPHGKDVAVKALTFAAVWPVPAAMWVQEQWSNLGERRWAK